MMNTPRLLRQLPRFPQPPQHRQSGAALLIAMIIVALVATLASAMVWQQWRAVQVEAAERARAQASWVLTGASDWARLILREDQGPSDNLGEPWALPLQEARLSTFLAADKNNTDDGPDAFLSGAIIDAQSRYNLRNLADPALTAQTMQEEIKLLVTLLDSIGVNGGAVGPPLAGAIQAAFKTQPIPAGGGNPTPLPTTTGTILQPQSIAQLAWFGVDDDTIARMTPYFIILPVPTMVNINTAPKEVLAAVGGVDAGTAQQWVQRRASKPFVNVTDNITAITPGMSTAAGDAITKHMAVISSYFEVHGRLRLSDRVLEETSLVRRDPGTRNVETILRRRESLRDTSG